MSEEKVSLHIRPNQKFKPVEIEGLIRKIVGENLEGKVYDHIYAHDWTISLTRQIYNEIKELELKRYKFAVQVVIGEDRGQGLKAICGGILDEETDRVVRVTFTGEKIFCIAAVFVVYSVCYN